MRSRLVRGVAATVGALGCSVAVAAGGELSVGALVAVGGAGAVVVVLGLRRRSGEGSAPVGRRALLWLVWLAAALSWEAVTLVSDELPTVSDLADPVLAHPVLRAAATATWLAGGAWLVVRPRGAGAP